MLSINYNYKAIKIISYFKMTSNKMKQVNEVATISSFLSTLTFAEYTIHAGEQSTINTDYIRQKINYFQSSHQEITTNAANSL